MNKSLLSSAVVAVMGIAATTSFTIANALEVTGFTIVDVGSNTSGSGGYSGVLDGVAGAFTFSTNYLNVRSYPGGIQFTGDVASGTLFGGGAANSTGSFSNGFLFLGLPFIPFTFGSGLNADETSGDGNLTVTTLDFGGQFAGGVDFVLPPDSNFPLQVLWSRDRGGGEWDVALRWGHTITTAEDATSQFTGFTTQWVLEGCMTTNPDGKCSLVPFPPTLSLIIPGGSPQECADAGGSTIPMNALISIHEDDALDAVSWTLDGDPVASGEVVDIVVPLGTHTVEATVTTILDRTVADSKIIVVRDTTAPMVNPKFVDKKTGMEITTIGNGEKAVPSFGISDVCDPDPVVVSATAGVPVENVDTIGAKSTGGNSKVKVSIQGSVDTIELTVVARDASGNMSSGEAELMIGSDATGDSDSDSDSS